MKSLPLSFAVVVAAGALVASCKTTQQVVIRDLPVGLQPIGALLDNCEHATEGGAVVARCEDNVIFKVREVEVEAGGSPRYFGDGVDLANNNAGKMSWATVELKTTVDRGVVDRGEVRAVDDDHVIVTVIAATRKHGPLMQTESSCQAPPDVEVRCNALMTAFLDLPPTDAAEARPTSGASNGRIAGRALSLPTSCHAVEELDDRGRYACDDGARLFWMLTPEMDDAAQQAAAAIASLDDADEAKDAKCALLDADTQCQETPTALIGLGYLEGKPLVVVCLADDPWNHGVCKAAFRRR